MKTAIATLLALALSLFFFSSPLYAADSWHELSAAKAIDSSLGKEKLLPEVKLYMKGQAHPTVTKKFGEFKSNQRSNKFGKSVETACDTAFISALIALQKRAEREGGNAVIDIYTVTKDEEHVSAKTFKCISGFAVANVALKGTVVKLR